jgi:hypothetical protein
VAQITVSVEDASMLREILDAKLIDLHREISHTDSRDFRQVLKQRVDMLERVLAQLPRAVDVRR